MVLRNWLAELRFHFYPRRHSETPALNPRHKRRSVLTGVSTAEECSLLSGTNMPDLQTVAHSAATQLEPLSRKYPPDVVEFSNSLATISTTKDRNDPGQTRVMYTIGSTGDVAKSNCSFAPDVPDRTR